MCIEIISLYLKGYIDTRFFEESVYVFIDSFQKALNESLLDELLNCDYSSSEQVAHLAIILEAYLIENQSDLYADVNDAYIENVIDSDRTDQIAEYLRKQQARVRCVILHCEELSSSDDLIKAFKDRLPLPDFCGNNWDSISDLIEEVLPEELHLIGWKNVEDRLPKDAKIIRRILCGVDPGLCTVYFE